MTIYINENIKRLRQEKGITQERLAQFLGVTFQSISKWERSESYPDITLLPAIADFFSVSIDELLGVNRSRKEKEISDLLEQYDNITDDSIRFDFLCKLRDKYPGDFRVMLREMGYFIFFDDPFKNTTKIMSLYETIQHNCVDDKVRICAKRYIANYYKKLSEKEGSGVTFEECEKIIKQMPYLRDSQEFLSAYLYPINHPKYCETLEEYVNEAKEIVSIMQRHLKESIDMLKHQQQ